MRCFLSVEREVVTNKFANFNAVHSLEIVSCSRMASASLNGSAQPLSPLCNIIIRRRWRQMVYSNRRMAEHTVLSLKPSLSNPLNCDTTPSIRLNLFRFSSALVFFFVHFAFLRSPLLYSKLTVNLVFVVIQRAATTTKTNTHTNTLK